MLVSSACDLLQLFSLRSDSFQTNPDLQGPPYDAVIFICVLQIDLTSWQLRVELARASMSLLKLDPEIMLGHKYCIKTLKESFEDPSYHARICSKDILDEALSASLSKVKPNEEVFLFLLQWGIQAKIHQSRVPALL